MSIFDWPFYTGFTIFLFLKIDFVLANSEDTDEMPHFAAFHLVFTVCKSTFRSRKG